MITTENHSLTNRENIQFPTLIEVPANWELKLRAAVWYRASSACFVLGHGPWVVLAGELLEVLPLASSPCELDRTS